LSCKRLKAYSHGIHCITSFLKALILSLLASGIEILVINKETATLLDRYKITIFYSHGTQISGYIQAFIQGPIDCADANFAS
jgi:hypothetical protein